MAEPVEIPSAVISESGTLYSIGRNITAFQFGIKSATDQNILLWVGGLGDTMLSVKYVSVLSKHLPNHWSVVQASLTSAGPGWGTASLASDADEIDKITKYFRSIIAVDKKIVLMGHSTGCQDAMEYVTGRGNESRLPLNGVILQAPVSDRESLTTKAIENIDAVVNLAKSYLDQGRRNAVLPHALTEPIFGNLPVSAYRCYSLISPKKDGDDDYFSSDLPAEKLRQTFGKFPRHTPLLILFSGNDEYVPKTVNVQGMINFWIQVVKAEGGIVDEENSGIVQGAFHNLQDNDSKVISHLCGLVRNFLERIDHGLGD